MNIAGRNAAISSAKLQRPAPAWRPKANGAMKRS